MPSANLMNEVRQSQIMIAVVSRESYNQQTLDLAKMVADRFTKICYVTINRSYSNLVKEFQNSKIDVDKFVFIDATPGDGKKTAPKDKCIFIRAPNDILQLSIGFAQQLDKVGFECAIFDSLDAIEIYANPKNIIKLVHTMINKVRGTDIKMIFITSEKDSEIMKELYMFIDKIVALT
ncbi:MAG: hypothetical protein HYT70_02830 [Candidatus Aenigmarchaeota archaeon]|nr:hypothetical protein [Candidatus Aenigmarchaeota archaeon]